MFSYWPCYMFSVCNNGPRMAVMALGVALGHYSHPRAIITDLEHITGPIWKHPFINTISLTGLNGIIRYINYPSELYQVSLTGLNGIIRYINYPSELYQISLTGFNGIIRYINYPSELYQISLTVIVPFKIINIFMILQYNIISCKFLHIHAHMIHK